MNTKYFNNNLNDNQILECISELKNNGIGIIPTDTVYGIACDCLNLQAIQNLFDIKKRNLNKPINILVSSVNMLKKCVKNISAIEEKLIQNFWPGPLTIIFNKSELIPDLLTSNLDTVGVRMPNNEISLNLINNLGNPLATSSANISDELPAIEIDDNLMNNFNNKVNFIINTEKIKLGLPSTIIKVEDNKIKILREGSISLNEIMEVLKDVR